MDGVILPICQDSAYAMAQPSASEKGASGGGTEQTDQLHPSERAVCFCVVCLAVGESFRPDALQSAPYMRPVSFRSRRSCEGYHGPVYHTARQRASIPMAICWVCISAPSSWVSARGLKCDAGGVSFPTKWMVERH